MSLSAQEEAQIRKAVEAIDDQDALSVLKGDETAQTGFWAKDLSVNAPNHQIMHYAQIIDLMAKHTGLQYSSFERHREATVVRQNCVVTMGYEIVIPKGNVPNSGKTINRRYTNVYYLDDGSWRLIGRQATNISIQ